jgi:uncharacterized iron-regulated membrane protein
MKIIMVLMLLGVLAALASAGVFMLRRRPPLAGQALNADPKAQRDKAMARALALRVALSVALFLFILLSWYMGWVKPSGLPLSR